MCAKHIKNILREYLTGPEFEEINKTINIQSLWEKTVGEAVSKNTIIKSFKKGTVIIKVSNPIWRNELSLQKQSIIEKLKTTDPELNIKEIILK